MFKIAIILSFALCLIGLYFGLHDHLLYSNYNIVWEKEKKGDPYRCSLSKTPQWVQQVRFLYFLSRENSDKIVCVVEGRKDGVVELNPKHTFGLLKCNYGPVKETTGITKSIATVLFGNPVEQSKNTSSYSLVVRSDLPATKDKKVLLDLKFEDSKLREFRIRSTALESTDWAIVRETEK